MIKLNLTPFIGTDKSKAALPRKKVNKIECQRQLICEININGLYFATDYEGTVHYPLSDNSYALKCKIHYAKTLYKGTRLEYTLLQDKKCGSGYLPFAPGIGLIGDVIKLDNGTEVFDVKKTFVCAADNEKANECFLFYKRNYDEIRANCVLRGDD